MFRYPFGGRMPSTDNSLEVTWIISASACPCHILVAMNLVHFALPTPLLFLGQISVLLLHGYKDVTQHRLGHMVMQGLFDFQGCLFIMSMQTTCIVNCWALINTSLALSYGCWSLTKGNLSIRQTRGWRHWRDTKLHAWTRSKDNIPICNGMTTYFDHM